jgi:pilus assembly protein Flp/PilA
VDFQPQRLDRPHQQSPELLAWWTERRRENVFLLEIQMLSIFRRLMKNERGATAIEYTLIASLIAVAAIVAMGSVGTKVNGVLSNVASTMG